MRSLPLLLLFAACLLAPPASAEWGKSEVAFSAVRTMRSSGMEMSGPLHHDSGKERWEVAMEGMRQVMIRRPDQDRMLMILPDMNMAMEMSLSQASQMPSADSLADKQPQEVGREQVAGETTTKYRIVEDTDQGAFTVFVWVTDDGIPLRMAGSGAQGSFEMLLTEVQRGAQDAGLFEAPAGVQIMPANPAMMGGMMGGVPQ